MENLFATSEGTNRQSGGSVPFIGMMPSLLSSSGCAEMASCTAMFGSRYVGPDRDLGGIGSMSNHEKRRPGGSASSPLMQ